MRERGIAYDTGLYRPGSASPGYFGSRPGGDPREDLDLASPGIVAVLDGGRGTAYPDMPWEPKGAFAAVAAHYSRCTDPRPLKGEA